MHVKVDCSPVLHSVKPNEWGGKKIAFVLPNEALDKVQTWAVDNKIAHFAHIKIYCKSIPTFKKKILN